MIPITGRIFSQTPLISFKRDKKISNFQVRNAIQTRNMFFSFETLRKYRDRNDPSRSLIISPHQQG